MSYHITFVGMKDPPGNVSFCNNGDEVPFLGDVEDDTDNEMTPVPKPPEIPVPKPPETPVPKPPETPNPKHPVKNEGAVSNPISTGHELASISLGVLGPVLNPVLNDHVSRFAQTWGNLKGALQTDLGPQIIPATADSPTGPQEQRDESPRKVGPNKKRKVNDHKPMDEDFIDPEL